MPSEVLQASWLHNTTCYSGQWVDFLALSAVFMFRHCSTRRGRSAQQAVSISLSECLPFTPEWGQLPTQVPVYGGQEGGMERRLSLPKETGTIHLITLHS